MLDAALDIKAGSMENIAITNTKYSVDLLNKYPHVIFVFGDNMIRRGKGGQAIIRDCQNSFGISTKRYPKNTQDAFYSDREDEINTTLRDMEQFKRLVLNGKPVILPRGGIGTGLACLPTKSPFIWKMLVEDFKNYGIILNESGFEKENKQ